MPILERRAVAAALAEIGDAGSARPGSIAGDGETIAGGPRPATISTNLEHESQCV
jgi:hypothetical protein